MSFADSNGRPCTQAQHEAGWRHKPQPERRHGHVDAFTRSLWPERIVGAAVAVGVVVALLRATGVL
jgi:hypothetical protein